MWPDRKDPPEPRALRVNKAYKDSKARRALLAQPGRRATLAAKVRRATLATPDRKVRLGPLVV